MLPILNSTYHHRLNNYFKSFSSLLVDLVWTKSILTVLKAEVLSLVYIYCNTDSKKRKCCSLSKGQAVNSRRWIFNDQLQIYEIWSIIFTGFFLSFLPGQGTLGYMDYFIFAISFSVNIFVFQFTWRFVYLMHCHLWFFTLFSNKKLVNIPLGNLHSRVLCNKSWSQNVNFTHSRNIFFSYADCCFFNIRSISNCEL